MIKSIIFDVDGTMYDETHAKVKAELKTALHISELSNIDVTSVFETFRSAKSDITNSFEGLPKRNDRGLWYAETFKRLGIRNISIENACDYYWDILYSNIEPYYDLTFILPELFQQYNLYVLTDELIDVQKKKMKILGLQKYFSVIISSEQIGESKPSKTLFKYILDLIGVDATEILYIGDNPMADIKGGNQVGMHTAWLKRGKFFFYNVREGEKADIVFNNYIQLKKYIKTLD